MAGIFGTAIKRIEKQYIDAITNTVMIRFANQKPQILIKKLFVNKFDNVLFAMLVDKIIVHKDKTLEMVWKGNA